VLTSPDDAAQLRGYTSAKQTVTEHVRAAMQLLRARGDAERVDQCQALLVKLAEDRFNLAVVGQFKRGKSSLMNAVIGRDLLPTGLLPLTSAITTLCYGPRERVALRRKGWVIEQEIPLDALADYITEPGNPGNEKGLVEARVELPVPFLRRGLHFVDTPGVGSAREENTATTYAFLPSADAVIFVTSVEAPLSETEQHFLLDIREHVRKLLVVVNKVDLLGGPERDAVLEYVRAHVARALGTADVRLYPVSARQGLVAKLAHDPDGLRASGLATFQDALTTFLAEEQGRAFLVAVLDRAARILADARSNRPDAPESLPLLLQAVESLRAILVAGTSLAALPAPQRTAPSDERTIERAIVARHLAEPRQGPRAGLRGGSCPICAAQNRAIFEFFAYWQYTLATSAAAQREFAAARGFCAAHTWQFQRIASPQGISEGYAPLIDAAAAALRDLVGGPLDRAASRIEALLAGEATCPACRMLRETEVGQVRDFIEALGAGEGRALYAQSDGLCLPHLRAALAGGTSAEVAEFLLRAQVGFLEEVAEDMRSYTLKRDAVRRGLLNDREEDAWRRAIVRLVGDRIARGE
jgi:GTP-binding protein EngB required for normal cell division